MSVVRAIVALVDGGTGLSLDELCERCGVPYDKLTPAQLAELEMEIFTCDQCDNTYPVDYRADTETSDGFLCKGCDE